MDDDPPPRGDDAGRPGARAGRGPRRWPVRRDRHPAGGRRCDRDQHRRSEGRPVAPPGLHLERRPRAPRARPHRPGGVRDAVRPVARGHARLIGPVCRPGAGPANRVSALDAAGRDAGDEPLRRVEEQQDDRDRDQDRRRGQVVPLGLELLPGSAAGPAARSASPPWRSGSGQEEVVPRGQEVEEEDDGQGRRGERKQDPPERAQLRAAVDPGGLLELDRDRVVVALEDPDAERDRGHGEGDHQADVRVRQLQLDREEVQRDQQHRGRDQLRGQERGQAEAAARELVATERVGGGRRDDQADDRGARS